MLKRVTRALYTRDAVGTPVARQATAAAPTTSVTASTGKLRGVGTGGVDGPMNCSDSACVLPNVISALCFEWTCRNELPVALALLCMSESVFTSVLLLTVAESLALSAQIFASRSRVYSTAKNKRACYLVSRTRVACLPGSPDLVSSSAHHSPTKPAVHRGWGDARHSTAAARDNIAMLTAIDLKVAHLHSAELPGEVENEVLDRALALRVARAIFCHVHLDRYDGRVEANREPHKLASNLLDKCRSRNHRVPASDLQHASKPNTNQ